MAGVVCATLATGIWALGSGDDHLTLGALLAGLIGLWIGYLGTAVVISRRRGTGSIRDDFGLRFAGVGDVGRGFLAAFAAVFLIVPIVYGVLVATGALSDRSLNELGDPADRLTALAEGPRFFVMAAFVGVGAPIVEELFFRGILQPAMVKRLGVVAGIGFTAVLFGAAHFQGLQFPALAAFGLLLGLLAHRYRRLGPSIVAHVIFNGLTLASLYLSAT